MNKAFGTVQHGEVKLDQPVDWTDGTRVEVCACAPSTGNGNGTHAESTDSNHTRTGVRAEFRDALQIHGAGGVPDSFWPLSNEETEIVLARMDAVPSLTMTDAEYEQLQEFFRSSKEEQKELMRKQWHEIESLFP